MQPTGPSAAERVRQRYQAAVAANGGQPIGAQGEAAIYASEFCLAPDQAMAIAQQVRNAPGITDAGINAIVGRVVPQATQPQQPTLQREQFEAQNALSWAQLQASQRGPDNAFAYLRTIQNTPDSIRGLINTALRGQGYLGGVAQAAGVGAPGAGRGDLGPGTTLGPLVHNPDGTVTHAAAATAAPATGGPALPLASQINAKDFLNSSPYLQKLVLAGYEANGQDQTQVLDDFQKSLPRYARATGAQYRQPTYG